MAAAPGQYGHDVPFTLAHPAAVLPLMRKPFAGPALVVGAMTPDIPYFLRATGIPVSAQSWYEPFTNATTSHSLAGLPSVAALGLLAYVFVLAAARPAKWVARGGKAAPTPSAAPRFETSSLPAHVLWVLVSLLVGTLTHLLWDSFASSDGFLAVRFDALNTPVVANQSWVDLLQYGSSVLGLAVLAFLLWRHRRALADRADVTVRGACLLLGGLAAVGLLAGSIITLATADLAAYEGTAALLRAFLTRTLIIGGAVIGCLVLLGTSLWWLAVLWAAHRPAVQPANPDWH